jgi:hypothetical protein
VRPGRLRFATGFILLSFSLLSALPLRAADAIQVRSAKVQAHDGLLKFTVRAQFPVDDQMRSALAAGATIYLDVQAVVDRKRSYWFDERLVDASLQRELSWNALSQRYVLRDAGSSEQQTYPTLEKALDAAGVVDDWRVDLGSGLDPDETYEVGVRARLRRGQLPSGLRELTSWTRYWNRSEWHTWVLSH